VLLSDTHLQRKSTLIVTFESSKQIKSIMMIQKVYRKYKGWTYNKYELQQNLVKVAAEKRKKCVAGGAGAGDGETSGVGGVRVPEGSSEGSSKGSSTRSSSWTTVTEMQKLIKPIKAIKAISPIIEPILQSA
jgi:hypothetical protein